MAPHILIISGATASGKSDLALKLAERRDIAIINGDSLQIYEGLPILSSQPSPADQKKVKHFLYSHFKPQEISSVATWLRLVKSAVEEVFRIQKLPVIVGGSGMYLSKLVEGISEIPEIDEAVRSEARRLYEEIGRDEFRKKIGVEAELDKQRLIRAYEVLKQTGKPIAYWQSQKPKKIFEQANFTHINLNCDRQKLYENCNLRFEKMLKLGAEEEVQGLMAQGVTDEQQITKTLGFYEIRDFILGKISRQKMQEIAKQKTRNYAKRQLTWFRHQLPQKLVFSSPAEALISAAKFAF